MKQTLAALLAVALIFSLTGCTPPQPRDSTLFLMDTAMELRVYGDDDGAVTAELTQVLEELDAKLDPRGTGALNRLNKNSTVEDETLGELLSFAQTLSAQTGGALDVTLLPLSKLWGFGEDAYAIPTGEKLLETKKRTGMDKLIVDGNQITLTDSAEVDLGALAKGYAADRCRAILEQHEMAGILSLGGNIQTVGTKPDRQPWTVGIQDPDQSEAYLMTLSVEGTKALVTSGDYQRYFEYDGVRYCHILDPETGSPVQGDLRSVTIVADSALLADGLSTALFVMGLEEATQFWQLNADAFEAVFLTADGAVYVTEGLAASANGVDFQVIAR